MTNYGNVFDDLLKDETLTREQKGRVINDYYDNYRQSIDRDLNNYLTKQYIGAGLQMGSAIPVFGTANVGAKIGVDLLSKTLGKKIAGEVGAGIVSGMASGAMFGLGRGISEGENVLKTIYQDSVNGMYGGMLLGGAGAYAKRFIDGKLLKKYGDIDILPDKQRQQYNADSRAYYKNYNQGIELGDINFTKRGVGETLRWNPKQAQNFPELVNDIKNANRLPDAPNLKPHQKPNVDHYELYQGKNGLHHIEVSKSGKKRFYITKDTPTEGIRATSTGRSGSIPGANSAYPIQTRAQDLEPNTIVNDIGNNINPAQPAIPEQSTSVEPYKLRVENFDWRTMPLADPLKKDKGTPTGFAASVADSSGVFSPEQIGKMSREEFDRNESAIMSQMKDGLIQNQPPSTNFWGFTNPVNGSKQIFSREDIGAMSTDEYSNNEKAINAQLNTIGVPTSNELNNAANFGGSVVYVQPYTRSDGVQVRGYYRSR